MFCRKVMAKWSELVKVPSVSAIGALPDDGFSWRKYGQKDILGSKFPRSLTFLSHYVLFSVSNRVHIVPLFLFLRV